jgi:hypothetical protein
VAEFIVELLVVVEADSATDATVMGERAQAQLLRVPLAKSGDKGKTLNVILADVRPADD